MNKKKRKYNTKYNIFLYSWCMLTKAYYGVHGCLLNVLINVLMNVEAHAMNETVVSSVLNVNCPLDVLMNG